MKQIVVLGGGISGYGSAILAKKKGFGVFLSDAGRIADRYKAKLDEWEVPYEEGGHTEERILAATEVVKSPGIPDTAPMVRKIREAGIPVISEMEFAGRYMGKAKCICITGSNGKTTTTSLIYKIMRDAGMNVALGGNIGESFAWSVATGDYDWYVLELSSFQLDGMYRFRAHVGVLMNITPDHLDRYDHCFQNYADSKMRIVQNMTSRDWFVYSGDDEVIWNEIPKYDLRMRQLPFAAKNAVASGAGDAFLCDGKFTATAGKASVEIDTAKLQIKGLHNAYNAMAAALATLAAGVAPAKIRKSLYAFAPVEHRLEPVAEKDGVLWINDSKATNVDSVYYALESMTRPVVWIAGGTDKGNDYEPLKAFARAKVHTLVCMGLDNAKLVREFTGVVPEVVSTDSLEAAMTASKAAARPGDAVLLSPACASWDMFANYAERSARFVTKAKEIAAMQSAGRIESLRIMKNAAFAGVYDLVLKYLLAFSDEPRKFVKVLPNGKEEEEEWNKYMFLAKDKYGDVYYRDNFSFSEDAAGTLATNRVAMWQEIQSQFIQGAFGNPQDSRTLELFWNMMDQQQYPLAKTVLAGIRDNAQHLPPEIEETIKQNPDVLSQIMQVQQASQGGGTGHGGARPNSGPDGNGATHATNVERTNERNRAANQRVVTPEQGGSSNGSIGQNLSS